jgi:opacity protein-like surface antigen
MSPIVMKKLSLLSTAILIGFLAAPLQAGTETYKQVAPPPPPVYAYGLGFYGAIDAGANVYQNRGDTRTFTADNRVNDITNRDFGATLEVNPKNDVGFYGGVKLGYVFGSGVVRPTVEGDFFYNGFRAGVGIYYAESAGVEVRDPVTGRVPINTGGGANHADLAWQVVAGSDYFFNPRFSAFIEYHYLDYTSTQLNTRENRDLGQHLVGAGVRFFFH